MNINNYFPRSKSNVSVNKHDALLLVSATLGEAVHLIQLLTVYIFACHECASQRRRDLRRQNGHTCQ